ncbi:hypothetical protein [Bradyrhizobium neotropicale]|uniref:hypothetical protein n=1 Tax=Bradyrhizobium neotropicale TaxID=1497615 RepID=UPI001AD770E5|nr:hypothetical protein [Bradyrhizobium neotropicale]MBO4225338.1 hypothetical protein [Bradyrhizobium neotropicale]
MSLERANLRIGPFAQFGQDVSTIGYRDLSSGQVVSSIELPTEILERSALANIAIQVVLSASGEIISVANGATATLSSAARRISVDDLVESLLDHDNLRMEEATESELRILLERLRRSVRAVESAIEAVKEAAR